MLAFMDREMAEVKQAGQRTSGGRQSGKIRRLGGLVLNHIYPPSCVHCQGVVGVPDGLCADCWRQLRPITAPMCPVLGLPFEVFIGSGALSAEAIADPPPFSRARSALVHNEVARAIVSRLKFGDRPELAKFCARMMFSAGTELFRRDEGEKSPLLVPVPLHRTRQWQRRYNQSFELARELGRLSGLEVAANLVRRTRPTKRQIGLNASQRARNVAGAFEVVPNALEITGGRGVIIVDDVITTGSTVRALSKALLAKGVTPIDVISFCRVVLGGSAPI